MSTIEINGTTYTVERAETEPNVYFLTGPRGGVLVAIPFSNDPTTFHAFHTTGTHADFRINRKLVKIPRADLEAATE